VSSGRDFPGRSSEKPNLDPLRNYFPFAGLIRDVDHYYDLYLSLQNSPDAGRRSRSISRMHQSLIQAQELVQVPEYLKYYLNIFLAGASSAMFTIVIGIS